METYRMFKFLINPEKTEVTKDKIVQQVGQVLAMMKGRSGYRENCGLQKNKN